MEFGCDCNSYIDFGFGIDIGFCMQLTYAWRYYIEIGSKNFDMKVDYVLKCYIDIDFELYNWVIGLCM